MKRLSVGAYKTSSISMCVLVSVNSWLRFDFTSLSHKQKWDTAPLCKTDKGKLIVHIWLSLLQVDFKFPDYQAQSI